MKKLDQKFDVIVGNPPYQKVHNNDQRTALWRDFCLKSFSLLEDKGMLALVLPNSWVGPSDNHGKTIFKTHLHDKLVEANIGECSRHFPENIGPVKDYFTYIICSNSDSKKTKYITEDGEAILSNEGIEYLPFNNITEQTFQILRVLKDLPKFRMISKNKYVHQNDSRLVIPNPAYMNDFFDRTPYIDRDNAKLICNYTVVSKDSYPQATQQSIDSVFKSLIYQFLYVIFYNGKGYPARFYNILPFFNPEIVWNDLDMCRSIGLEKYIAYMEQVVSKKKKIKNEN